MHPEGFLHKLLLPVIHKSRVKVLSDVVLTAIELKDLTLTKLGREMNGIQERSGIQKVNRLLGNQHLQEDKKLISKSICSMLIGSKKYPKIIVDWSKYPNSKDGILRAALASEGRAVTLYEERHAFKKMGNRKIHDDFLKELKKLLPEHCQPVIVTDAGFHNGWFKEVLKLGWDYVGRIRGMKKCCFEGEQKFYECKKIFRLATKEVKCLGKMVITKQTPMISHVYLVKGKLTGRKVLTKKGRVNKHKDSKAYSRANREPWLLMSSLNGRNAAKKVQRVYKLRMTIEEAFRDLKSSKYGLGLEKGKTIKESRRNIWLLIAMLASLIAWLFGKAAENMKLHYQFQTNSIKTRRVISLFNLGCRIIKRKIFIAPWQIQDAIKALQENMIYA